MTAKFLATAATLALLLTTAPVGAADKKTELDTMTEKVSYGIGMNIGRDFKRQGLEVDPDLLARGIRDAMAEKGTLMTEEEVQETMMAFQQQVMGKQEEARKAQAGDNLKQGKEFMARNAMSRGVKTTPSGLQYKVIEAGKGKSPTLEDTVTVNYKGTLIDGTEFDSSYKRGEPATFPVKGVIPGWTEVLQMMKEGGKWEVVIPPDLAYGERGAGPVIGPNATLVFEVELLKVNDQKQQNGK